MESATRLEITFKSGDTITYREGEWDDYGYDGKAICVKLKARGSVFTTLTMCSVSS